MFDRDELELLKVSLVHNITHVDFSKSDINFEDIKNLYHKIKKILEIFPDKDNIDYSVVTISEDDFWNLLEGDNE